MADRVFTGIDIGSESVKFVTARKGRNGSLHVLNAGIASLGDASALPEGDTRVEAVAAVLKGLLSDRRAKTRKVHTCVSGKKVITRYAHVPPMPPRRLEKVMAFEIDNEAPGGGEDIASDFKLLDLPNKDAEFTVLIGMAKEEVIDAQKRIFESVGIKVQDVTLGCLPTFHSFVHSKKAELDSMAGPCAVVNIGAEKMEMIVVYGGRLYFARSLTPGGVVFTEAIRQELRIPFEAAERIKRQRGRIGEEQPPAHDDIPVIPMGGTSGSPDDEDTALGSDDDAIMIPQMTGQSAGEPGEQIKDPIRRVLERAASGMVNSIKSCLRYAKAQTKLENLEVNRIYITGGGAKLPGLARYIGMRLGIETEVFDPGENVDCSALDPAGREMLEAQSHVLVTALGLVAGQIIDVPVRVSLLPRAEKERKEFMRHGVYGWAASGVFGVTIAAMIASSFFSTRVLSDFTERQAVKIKQGEESKKTLLELRAENTHLGENVDRLREIALESKTCLSALSVLKGKRAGGAGAYEFPREVMLKSVRTYAGTNPPAHKTIESAYGSKAARRFGEPREIEKQPKVVRVEGTVSEKVDPDEIRDIVRKLIEYLAGVEGPLGKRVFMRAEPIKVVAEGEQPYFEIELVVNEE